MQPSYPSHNAARFDRNKLPRNPEQLVATRLKKSPIETSSCRALVLVGTVPTPYVLTCDAFYDTLVAASACSPSSPVEARCDLLDCIQLFEGVLDPVLVTVLHLLQFADNVVVAGLLGGGETLLEIRATGIDWFVEDHNLTKRSEVAESLVKVIFTHMGHLLIYRP